MGSEDAGRESRRDTFVGAAEEYAAARPAYPETILEASVELGELEAGASILEVGCGTGLATEWYGRRGYSVHAIDRAADMIRIAWERTGDLPNVTVEHRDFEAGRPERRYDALLFATSFHWLDPRHRAENAGRALRPGGALILLWHTHPPPYTGYFERVQPIYRRLVPGWDPPPSPGMSEDRIAAVVDELEGAAWSRSVLRRSHDWSRTYDRARYRRLLETYSDHRLLPDAVREELSTEVGRLIDEEFGGVVVHPYRTELVVVRKA